MVEIRNKLFPEDDEPNRVITTDEELIAYIAEKLPGKKNQRRRLAYFDIIKETMLKRVKLSKEVENATINQSA